MTQLLSWHMEEKSSETCQDFGIRHKGVENLVVDTGTKGLNRDCKNMVKEVPGVCASMWSSEENDATCRLEDGAEVRLRGGATSRDSQCLLDNNPPQAVGNEENGTPLLLGVAAKGFEGAEEVFGVVVDGVLAHRPRQPMFDLRVVSIRENS